jgi:hypothetical protein
MAVEATRQYEDSFNSPTPAASFGGVRRPTPPGGEEEDRTGRNGEKVAGGERSQTRRQRRPPNGAGVSVYRGSGESRGSLE